MVKRIVIKKIEKDFNGFYTSGYHEIVEQRSREMLQWKRWNFIRAQEKERLFFEQHNLGEKVIDQLAEECADREHSKRLNLPKQRKYYRPNPYRSFYDCLREENFVNN